MHGIEHPHDMVATQKKDNQRGEGTERQTDRRTDVEKQSEIERERENKKKASKKESKRGSDSHAGHQEQNCGDVTSYIELLPSPS